MKHYVWAGLASLFLFTTTGCGNLQKLKDVNTLGIAGVTYGKSIHYVKENGDSSEGTISFSLDKEKTKSDKKLTFTDFDPELKKFFDSVFDDLVKEVTSQGINVKLAPSFKDNPVLSALYKDDRLSDFAYFNPEGYVSGRLYQNIDQTKKLAESIPVDAIAYLSFNIVRKSERVLLIPVEKLGLEIKMTVIHKDGTKILNNQVFQVFSDTKIDFNKILMGNSSNIQLIDPNSQALFDSLRVEIQKFIKEKIAEGRK